MDPLFTRRTAFLWRLALLALLIGGGSLAFISYISKWTPWQTEVGQPVMQPVPFSHKHHVDGLGIDCRYCHTTVMTSAHAGLPATHTCMTCHSQIWQNAAVLDPVRKSFSSGQNLRWNRVYRLPQYVYFDHSIHLNKGVGCSSCHGPVEQMPITWKARPFYMKDCLNCHREPEKFLRPQNEVLNMSWSPPPDQINLGKSLIRKYHIPIHRLTDCSICHR